MIKKNTIIRMLLISIVFGLTSACLEGKEPQSQQERAKEIKVVKEEKQKKRIIYFADLIKTKKYRITKKYEQELSKNSGLLRNDLDYHGKPKSIFHHPLQKGDNNITFPNIEIESNTKVKFSLGIFKQDRYGFSSDGVQFVVILDVEGEKEIIFSETVTEVDKWKNIVLDLSGYSGRKGAIELLTQPLTTWNYDWATWGSPRIVNYSVEKDYYIKSAGFAGKHDSIVYTYGDIALPQGANRVDNGWFAEAKVTDINLAEVDERVVIRSEIYVLEKSEKLDEEIKVEVLDDAQELISVGRYPISAKTRVIVNEYRVNDLANKPKIVRISLDRENPSLFFIKHPIHYSISELSGKDSKKSVILISLDTLRADHLGCYGYTRDVSPNIDKLAEESFLFTRAYSNSNWTLPTHISMFTSLYPVQHQAVLKTYENGVYGPYETPYLYVPEDFQKAGYLTLAYTGGGFVHSQYGFNKGFDYYFEEIKELNTNSLELLIELIEQNKNIPLFLFFHTYEIHDYYTEKLFYRRFVDSNFNRDEIRLIDHIYLQALDALDNKRYKKIRQKLMPDEAVQYLVDLYDGAIAYTDSLLGEFFKTLKDFGIYDDAWIVITSDHGEGFGDIHNNNNSSSWTHGSRLYDSQILVPLIIKPPKALFDAVTGDRRVDMPVETIDIAPTLVSTIGVARSKQYMGSNLLPFLVNEKSDYKDVLFSEELNSRKYAVISGDYKLMMKPFSKNFADRRKYYYELYNLREDKQENRNLLKGKNAAKWVTLHNELKGLLDDHVRGLLEDEITTGRVDASIEGGASGDKLEERKRRLKELGYL